MFLVTVGQSHTSTVLIYDYAGKRIIKAGQDLQRSVVQSSAKAEPTKMKFLKALKTLKKQ